MVAMDEETLPDFTSWNIKYGDMAAGTIMLILLLFWICVGCIVVRVYSLEEVRRIYPPEKVDSKGIANYIKKKKKPSYFEHV